MNCIDYVCGFAFTTNFRRVALIEKKRGPAGMVGKLNGIGGKIEKRLDLHEGHRSAMAREFHEETGFLVPYDMWLLFHIERHSAAHTGHGKEARIFFMTTMVPGLRVQNTTDEMVALFYPGTVDAMPHMENLEYLIPMARNYIRYPQHRYLEG